VIEVGTVSKTNWLTTTRTILAIPAIIISIYGIGKLFEIW
jgi:hypothetical protein